MSEILTGEVDPAAKKMGFTPLFAGVFLLATVGNAAELLNAVHSAGSWTWRSESRSRHHAGRASG